MTLRGFLLTGALGAALLLGGAGTAEARDTCSDRIQREQIKLQRDIRKHGAFSHQARNRREKIARLRQQCGFFGFRNDRRDNRRWDRDRDRDRDDRQWDRNNNRWRNRDRDRDRDRDRRNWFWDGRRWRRH